MKKPFLFDIVNRAYHKVMNHAPRFLQERSTGSAFVLGYAGNYLLVDGIQLFSEYVMPQNFNQNVLPALEKLCVVLTISIPVIYSFIKPKEMKGIMQEHPTYTSGMIGAGLGAIHSTLENII